jgi:hypothetical protein
MTNETRDRDLGMDRPIDRRPWIVGRKRFGRIAIANSDSAAICLTQAAIEQAHRAVQELLTDVIRRQFRFPYTEKV